MVRKDGIETGLKTRIVVVQNETHKSSDAKTLDQNIRIFRGQIRCEHNYFLLIFHLFVAID